MPLIPNSNTKKFDIPSAHFTTCAAPSLGARETAVWHVTINPKSEGLPHQVTREEIIVALSGSAVAEIGTQKHTVSAGDTLIIPPHVDFILSNPNAAEFSAIAVFPVGGRAVIENQIPFTPPWAA
jgi:quercetin dioxygenase-like cupin family protein